ncbi:MAG: 50S ribosomal protein L32 [Candidatus Gracilibacteria bacterium]|nr:50S ribosomal protein L32 [Candidatus Gracilibacteria bacterium]
MAIVPTKKTSKSRTNKRTTNWIKLTAKKLKDKVMLNKDENGLAHFMAEDGTYNGRTVIKAKKKKTNTTRI